MSQRSRRRIFNLQQQDYR